jgi:hypothetical protein
MRLPESFTNSGKLCNGVQIRTILTPDESLLGGDPTTYFRFQQVERQWALIEHGVVESTNVEFRS